MMAPPQNHCPCCPNKDGQCYYCADYDGHFPTDHCEVKPVPLWQLIGCGALAVFVLIGIMAVMS